MPRLICSFVLLKQKLSATRGPLKRSASLEDDSTHLMPPLPSRYKPIQRQISLPDYQLSASFGPGPGLEIIQVCLWMGNIRTSVDLVINPNMVHGFGFLLNILRG